MDQSQREQEIFKAALEVGTPEKRRALVRVACGEDQELLRKVEALLAAYFASQSYVPTGYAPASPPREPSGAQEGPGTVLGHYKLLQKIGEGGCGVVYMAEQAEPVRRRVALKIIKLGMDTRNVTARFEAERQALALMEHANIAKVLDAGATESGRPYFVMELVKGIKITEYCDQNHLATRERLELFLQVCHAIQHAHQKGIIHRDIKPSNILVSLHDGVPVPVVIDFGIAKATEQPLTDKTMFTAFEQFIGTPAYMSPEQAELSRLDIDTRSDIYSLGVLLYELLTGQTPFDSAALLASGVEGMRRTLREQEPVRPSTRLGRLAGEELTTTAARRRTEAPKLIHLVRGDLDWIVMKCLEKDRTRRYETANGLALDIERHLNNEPVVARPPTTAYKVQKFIRRNKVMVGAAGLVALALLLGIMGSTWQAVRATQARRQAVDERERQRSLAYAADMNLAQRALAQNNRGRAKDLLDRHRPQPGDQDLRGWEWRYLWRQCRSDERKTLWAHSNIITGVAFSPDGTRLAAQSENGEVRLWNVRTESEVPGWRLQSTWSYWGRAPAFTPDGKLATANGIKGVQVWDIGSRLLVTNYPVECKSELVGFAFAPQGGRLAIGQKNGIIQLWDVATHRRIDLLTNGPGRFHMGLAFSPDGRLLAAGGTNFTIRVWDVASGQLVHTLANGPGEAVAQWFYNFVVSVAFSPDGRILASGGWDEAVNLWDVATGQLKTNLATGIGRIEKIQFSPDGNTLAVASADYSIRLWNATNYMPIARLKGHLYEIWSLSISPNGQLLASGGKDGTVRLWDARPRSEDAPRLEFELSDIVSLSSPDRRWFASITATGTATLWEAATLRERARVETGETNAADAAVSPNGSMLAVGTSNGKVRFWDFDSRREEPSISVTTNRVFPVFSPDGRMLLTVDNQSLAKLWDLTTRRETADLSLDNKTFWHRSAAFSPNGSRLAVGLQDRESAMDTLALWDTVNRKWINQVEGRWTGIGELAFSPDGTRLASALGNGTARIWNLPDFQSDIPPLKGPVMSMDCVGFSPNGKRLVTGGDHGIVQLWDAETGQQVGTLEAQPKACRFTFFPDNDSILTMGWENRQSKPVSAILWRASSFEEIRAEERARAHER